MLDALAEDAQNPSSGISSISEDTTPALGGDLDTDGKNVKLTPTAGGADQTASGLTATMTAGETLAIGDACYLKSDGKMWKADANGTSTYPSIGIALAAIEADATGDFLFYGFFRDDSYDNTVGGNLYLSATAGAITQTAPTTTGDQVQVLGVATHADRIFLNPQLVLVEHA